MKLLVVLFGLVGLGSSCSTLEVPNAEVCVGTLGGGFCKFLVTGEERFPSREMLSDMVWSEGAVIMDAEGFAAILVLIEKVCNRQWDECEVIDDGKGYTAIVSLRRINGVKSDNVYDN